MYYFSDMFKLSINNALIYFTVLSSASTCEALVENFKFKGDFPVMAASKIFGIFFNVGCQSDAVSF